ncbi:MAG: ATP-dependent DNA helicase, partial [archaeon]
TGKTHTIVEKINYLIKNKIYSPERVVCITFSNEAANNLMMRVRREIDGTSREPIIRTFHAFSADLLRKYGERIGIKGDFNILDPDQAKVVLHRNFKIPVANCHSYIHSIGTAKDLGITIEQVEEYLARKKNEIGIEDVENRLENLQLEFQTLYKKGSEDNKKVLLEEIKILKSFVALRKFASSWKAYEKLKNIKNYQDYSDLNKNALILLKKHGDIAKNYDYIVVDEFQDTNKIQLELLIELAPHRNITVVGDMNQSIYRFRGAYKENFSLFKHNFNVKKEDVFSLDKSRRSPNKVLRAAGTLIANNYANPDEVLQVGNFEGREGGNINVFELNNSKEEARKVVELVREQLNSGVPAEEICVMFRTHQQGRIIKKALEAEDIHYTSATKNSLLKENKIKLIIDYLEVVDRIVRKQKGGEQAWWDIIYQSGFSDNDIIVIGGLMKKQGRSDSGEENKKPEISISEKMLAFEMEKLSEPGKKLYLAILERIKYLQPLVTKKVEEFVSDVAQSLGFVDGDEPGENRDFTSNLNRLVELVKSHSALYYPELESFIHYLEILGNLGIEISVSESREPGVQLMTLHSTKGLEYKTVIITNMAQKRFPIERISFSSLLPVELSPEIAGKIKEFDKKELEVFLEEYERQNQLYEERRLCYVAFTRAKENLFLTYAKEYAGRKFDTSQFLYEVEYKKNPDFAYILDEENKFVEPLPAIVPADKNIVEKKTNFSPSALLLFSECQKEYEYKYVYNMPDRKTYSWDAIRMGSFVHEVLEHGVKENLRTLKEYIDYAKGLQALEDWESVELEEALHLIRVFFERNKDKYDEKSKTELFLSTDIEGIRFIGYADRIDYKSDGLEIIDYKTGKSNVAPKHRNWQLGYYALAASKYGKVKRLTLDMLKHEKPLEFEVDDSGMARAKYSSLSFDIKKVRQEIVDTAKAILKAYEQGFKPCPMEKNCDFCGEFVYGKKQST